MVLNQFLKIFGFLCKSFWSFLEIVYNVPLTNNVHFGDVFVFAFILFCTLFIIFRPLKK